MGSVGSVEELGDVWRGLAARPTSGSAFRERPLPSPLAEARWVEIRETDRFCRMKGLCKCTEWFDQTSHSIYGIKNRITEQLSTVHICPIQACTAGLPSLSFPVPRFNRLHITCLFPGAGRASWEEHQRKGSKQTERGLPWA